MLKVIITLDNSNMYLSRCWHNIISKHKTKQNGREQNIVLCLPISSYTLMSTTSVHINIYIYIYIYVTCTCHNTNHDFHTSFQSFIVLVLMQLIVLFTEITPL